MNSAKSYEIPKSLVWEAYKKVKTNRGSAGIDDETIREYVKKQREEEIRHEQLRLWKD